MLYQFKDEKLLLQALTRRSASNEGLQKFYIGDFQHLEFIGGRVHNLVASDILFELHPNWNEGKLTTELNKITNN
ncbi:MAG: Ribonuclease 3 [Legionellaceae bacterium]